MMPRAEDVDHRRRHLLGAASLGMLAVTPLARSAAASPVVRTSAGRIRGIADADLRIFRGIRYGADTAPRRFMPPVAPEPWPGVLDATAFGAASLQPGSEANQSEDCLFLNIIAPAANAARPRPVIVYIHG